MHQEMVREMCIRDRPYCGHSHHSSGSRAGAPAENGQGHGPADLHRQFHLRDVYKRQSIPFPIPFIPAGPSTATPAAWPALPPGIWL